MEDRVGVVSSLVGAAPGDLHFRFIGQAKGREFVVNLQCSASNEAGEQLKPQEYDFQIAKVLNEILAHIAGHPNSALH